MMIIDNPHFLDLPKDVASIFSAAQTDSFFGLPEWYDLVHKYGMEEPWLPRLYTNGKAIFLSSESRHRNNNEIRSLLNPYTIEHCLLIDGNTDDRVSAVRTLMAEVARHSTKKHLICLSGLDPTDRSFHAISAGFRDAGFVSRPFRSWVVPFEVIEGRDFSSYLASRPSQLQNTWRRRKHALDRSTDLSMSLNNIDDVEAFIEDYEDVYRRSWKEPEPFPLFVPELIRAANSLGALRCGTLYFRGNAIASQFWIVWKRKAYIFKLAHDADYKSISPGTILTMAMIRTIIESDNPSELNFGRGDDPYKRMWASQRREYWGIAAANGSTILGLKNALLLTLANARDRLFRQHNFANNG